MIRMSVSVDPELLQTAAKMSGAHTKTEAIERALHALIQENRRAQAIRHAGAFPLTITRKELRRLRHQH